MDMSNMLVGAQIENLKKDIDVKDKTIDDIQSQIDKRDGIDTKEGESRVKLNESTIKNNAAAFDYNSEACCDSGCCYTAGCTDATATNYDPTC